MSRAWLDTGTHAAVSQASTYVQTIQERQEIQIACIEEIAYNQGFIDITQLEYLAGLHAPSAYGTHISRLLQKAQAPLPV